MELTRCDRCGTELPLRRMKEIAYEQGRERVQELLCPSCLDKAMNSSGRVRGIVGMRKHAAAHLDPGGGPAAHQPFGERERSAS